MIGGSINICYNIGAISGNETGGILGSQNGKENVTISNCYNTGNIKLYSGYRGGPRRRRRNTRTYNV